MISSSHYPTITVSCSDLLVINVVPLVPWWLMSAACTRTGIVRFRITGEMIVKVKM